MIDGDGDGDAVAVGDVDGGKEPDGDVTGVVEEVAELGGVLAGAPLVHEVPGRAGWELRGVVQGGLRILERIERSGHACLQVRPTLGVFDLPILAWRALRMRASTAQLVGESA